MFFLGAIPEVGRGRQLNRPQLPEIQNCHRVNATELVVKVFGLLCGKDSALGRLGPFQEVYQETGGDFNFTMLFVDNHIDIYKVFIHEVDPFLRVKKKGIEDIPLCLEVAETRTDCTSDAAGLW